MGGCCGRVAQRRYMDLFDQIDKDKSGFISLREMNESSYFSQYEVACCRSLFLFYRFDGSTGQEKNGKLSRDEFERMCDYLVRFQKVMERQRRVEMLRAKHSSCISLRMLLPASCLRLSGEGQAPSAPPFAAAVDAARGRGAPASPASAASPYSSCPPTPSHSYKDRTGFGSESGAGSAKPADRYAPSLYPVPLSTFTSMLYQEGEGHGEGEAEAQQDASAEGINVQHRRRAFGEWLFRVADLDGQEQVTQNELALMLDALSQQGVNTHSLYFESEYTHLDEEGTGQGGRGRERERGQKGWGSSPEGGIGLDRTSVSTLQGVMSHYDLSCTDTLNREEFMNMTNDVLTEYTHYERWVGSHAKQVGRYKLYRTLGVGSDAIVKYGLYQDEADEYQSVAVKIVPQTPETRRRVDRELCASQVLKHPNILRLVESFTQQSSIFLVTPLCGGGTLYEVALSMQVTEEIARFFFYQVLKACDHMHRRGIAHRDIRLENVVIDMGGDALLTDFGHSVSFDPSCQDPDNDSSMCTDNMVGSLYSLSPEMLTRQHYSAVAKDLWSLGVLLYSLVAHRRPFQRDTQADVFAAICAADYPPLPEGVSPELRDLIGLLLSPDPSARPRCADIRHHPWLYRQRQHKPAISEGLVEVTTCLDQLSFFDSLVALMHQEKLTVMVLRPEAEVAAASEGRQPLPRLLCRHDVYRGLDFTVTMKLVSQDSGYQAPMLGSPTAGTRRRATPPLPPPHPLRDSHAASPSSPSDTHDTHETPGDAGGTFPLDTDSEAGAGHVGSDVPRAQPEGSPFRCAGYTSPPPKKRVEVHFYMRKGATWTFKKVFGRIRHRLLSEMDVSSAHPLPNHPYPVPAVPVGAVSPCGSHGSAWDLTALDTASGHPSTGQDPSHPGGDTGGEASVGTDPGIDGRREGGREGAGEGEGAGAEGAVPASSHVSASAAVSIQGGVNPDLLSDLLQECQTSDRR
ncbi:hypothetical protein KIPB_006794 [Kipferlia bialata]|uniref:Protein kinase n=1 Tax=Kipferlia bialata TaxID=797122 RepID=A0A9K3CZR5_9EUKA|nr:hypothetical protein KIPB_006794 [Kipferlia bialata]|eukprot:g6794.t1